MWIKDISTLALMALIGGALIVAVLLDISGVAQPYYGGAAFTFATSLCVVYFTAWGSLFRFGVFRKQLPTWIAVIITVVGVLGWSVLMGVLGDNKHRPSLVSVLLTLACYRLLRHAKLASDSPKQTDSISQSGQEVVGAVDAAIAPTQQVVSQVSQTMVTSIRRVIWAIPLCTAVLILVFPFYIATIARARDGNILVRIPHGPRFFALPAPAIPEQYIKYNVDGKVYDLNVRQDWALDWSRSLHAFLLLTGLAFGVYLFGTSRFTSQRSKKREAEVINDRHKHLFTDEIVQEILSGQFGVIVGGRPYRVGATGLISTETKLIMIDANTSARIAGSIPYPKELLLLLEQQKRDRASQGGPADS